MALHVSICWFGNDTALGLMHPLARVVRSVPGDTREHLRALLRETAQSVAVVTALLPAISAPTYHGATLSSFTSIAFDPLPLVAFSLRVPSRMASALNSNASANPHPPCALPPSLPGSSAHFIINILSAAQPHLADCFARPDIYPHPFADSRVHYTTSLDGLPILSGALGALSCRLVCPSLPLAHLRESALRAFDNEPSPSHRIGEQEAQQASGGIGLASELFIARVLRVECASLSEDDADGRDGSQAELHKLPLLYHRRRYTTVENHSRSDS